MSKYEKRIERATCRKLAAVCAKKYTLSEALARYDKAYAYFIGLVSSGDGSSSSGALIEDATAYVNALARYCATRGVHKKEIR